MITIINFSHPVQSNRPDVEAVVSDEYQVFDVVVHLDQSRTTLLPAIDCIFAEAKQLAGGNIRNIDCIILPGLAMGAVMIVEAFCQSGYIPNILRMAPAHSRALLPRFEAVEVVRLRQPGPDNWGDEGSFGI